MGSNFLGLLPSFLVTAGYIRLALLFILFRSVLADIFQTEDFSVRVVFKGESESRVDPHTSGYLEPVSLDGDTDLTPFLEPDLTLGQAAEIRIQLQATDPGFHLTSVEILDANQKGISAILEAELNGNFMKDNWKELSLRFGGLSEEELYIGAQDTAWDAMKSLKVGYSGQGNNTQGSMTTVKIRLVQVCKKHEAPAVCMMERTRSYSTNCIECNCQQCHSCGCHSSVGRCDYDSCDHHGCWCLPVCRCCHDSDCGYDCNCETCCDHVDFNYCLTSNTYHLDSILPSYGSGTGGETILISGGPFLSSKGYFCKFGNATSSATFVHVNQLRCPAPKPEIEFLEQLKVPVSISADGKSWTQEIVEYSYVHCQNGCNGHGICTSHFECACDEGWVGSDCELQCPGEEEARPCSDQGACYESKDSLAVCVCKPGFAGENCDAHCPVSDEEEVCSSHGMCDALSGDCICSNGWTGEICSVSNGNSTCLIGYGGDLCELECPGSSGCDQSTGCATTCQGHGECLSDGSCLCDSGYSGEDCSEVCVFCQHGSCDQIPGICVCSDGFFGEDCSNSCPSSTEEPGIHCNGHGRCDHSYGCICDPGWKGDACDVECSGGAANPCSGHGLCLSQPAGNCSCDGGWFGHSCDHSCPGTVDTPCSGHGQCAHPSGVCQCSEGWYGFECSQSCPGGGDSPCNGHGTCGVKGSCQCFEGYWSLDCSDECPGSLGAGNGWCNGHGTCTSFGTCECSIGFTGLDCSESICEEECNHQGNCVEGSCHCNYGYGGPSCGDTSFRINTSTSDIAFIQFDQTQIYAGESIGSIWINVTRSGSVKDAISVRYSTKDLTAIAGEDYEMRMGVIEWPAGISEPQRVQLSVMKNDRPESEEAFEIVLYSPWPEDKCFLGDPSMKIVRIEAKPDDDEVAFARITLKSLQSPADIMEGTESGETFKFVLLDTIVKGTNLKLQHLLVNNVQGSAKGGTLVTLDIIPQVHGMDDIDAFQQATVLKRWIGNPNSLLYGEMVNNELKIDISFEPIIRLMNIQELPEISENTSKVVKQLNILYIFIISFILLVVALLALAVWKRKPLSEYLLWKLAAFRFNRMHDERNFSDFDEECYEGVELPDAPRNVRTAQAHASQSQFSLMGKGVTVPSLSNESNM